MRAFHKPMHAMRLVACLVAATVLLSGCVSGWISRGTAMGRDVLQPGKTQVEIAERFGDPIADTPAWVTTEARRWVRPNQTWVVWRVRGRPAQHDDGTGEATLSAMTLGLGEVFLLPMTVAKTGAESMQTFYLIAYFNPDARLSEHRVLPDREK